MASSSHYHVLVGLCGLYTPSSNYVVETRKQADDTARELADRYRDDGEHVTGSARTGYHVGDSECIEITDCDDPECLADLDE